MESTFNFKQEEFHKPRLRTVADLEQKAISLETELRERRRTEHAIRRLAAIVESSDDAILWKDLDGIVKSWNKGAERIFGYTPEEVIGQPVTILIPVDHLNEVRGILERIRRGERVDHYETVRRRKDGTLVDISLSVSPIKDEQGNVIGASKIARDISERKKIERQLAESLQREKAAREMAEAAGRAKDSFLAMLSHELRTPMTPVLLVASDGVANPTLPSEIKEQFQTILTNVESQTRLVDDLLDLSGITHSKMALNFQILDAHAVLRDAIQTVKAQIEAKRIQMGVELNAEHFRVSGDAVRLQQIFWNVIKNAVKFTPEGGKLAISTYSSGQSNPFTVTVTDTGIGMRAEELEHIFLAFSQGNHARERSNYGGLGLGLAIAKKLVELHSGRIQASSQGRCQGSTFTIELPLAR